jgi:hypothetical protein
VDERSHPLRPRAWIARNRRMPQRLACFVRHPASPLVARVLHYDAIRGNSLSATSRRAGVQNCEDGTPPDRHYPARNASERRERTMSHAWDGHRGLATFAPVARVTPGTALARTIDGYCDRAVQRGRRAPRARRRMPALLRIARGRDARGSAACPAPAASATTWRAGRCTASSACAPGCYDVSVVGDDICVSIPRARATMTR